MPCQKLQKPGAMQSFGISCANGKVTPRPLPTCLASHGPCDPNAGSSWLRFVFRPARRHGKPKPTRCVVTHRRQFKRSREEPMKTRVLLTAAALALAAGVGNAQQTASDGLGTVHFPISCTAVQAKFERAVALLHNFHYPE